MIKRTSIIVMSLILLTCTMLCGCSFDGKKERKTAYSTTDLFFDNSATIYVDDEEDVMYLFMKGTHACGLTAMASVNSATKTYLTSQYKVVKLYDDDHHNIIVDEEENTVFLFIHDGIYSGLVQMIKSDGTPKEAQGLDYETKYISDINGFGKIKKIYRDSEQDTMYLYIQDGVTGGFTQMYAKNANPKLKANSNYETIDIEEADELGEKINIYVDSEENVMYLYIRNMLVGDMVCMRKANGLPKLNEKTKYSTKDIMALKDKGILKSEIYRDKEEETMFFFLKDERAGGLSQMYKANGKPKTIY